MNALLVFGSGRRKNLRSEQRLVIMYVRPGTTARGRDMTSHRTRRRKSACRPRNSTWVRSLPSDFAVYFRASEYWEHRSRIGWAAPHPGSDPNGLPTRRVARPARPMPGQFQPSFDVPKPSKRQSRGSLKIPRGALSPRGSEDCRAGRSRAGTSTTPPTTIRLPARLRRLDVSGA